MNSRNCLVISYIGIICPLVFGLLVFPAQAEPEVSDERAQRFQSLTLNGQIADDGKILNRGAIRYSKGRLCLILFGDDTNGDVRELKSASVEMLKRMASIGHNIAFMHVDTGIYKEGPAEMFWENDKAFVSPSFLIYVDGLQMSYHSDVSVGELRHIKGAMVAYGEQLMGWADKARQKVSGRR